MGKGAIISAEELTARWGYVEIDSSRFGPNISRHLDPELVSKARQRVPFAQIPRHHWPDLTAALEKNRNKDFVGIVDRASDGLYESIDWGPADLLSCFVLPVLGGCQYYRFLAVPPPPDASGKPRSSDPRHAAMHIASDPDFTAADPLIAIWHRGRPLLWSKATSAASCGSGTPSSLSRSGFREPESAGGLAALPTAL